MAKYCAFCGKKLGIFDWSYTIQDSDYEYCMGHLEKLSEIQDDIIDGDGSGVDLLKKSLKNSLECISNDFDDAIEVLIKEWENQKHKSLDLERREKDNEEKRAIVEKLEQTIILTTGSSFDGYTVDKYIDVICEEVVFKNSFLNQISAELEDLGSAFSFKEKELTGSSELIKKAREYVMKKFRRSAAELGANAILGVDFENSFGDKIVRVSVSGTAVVISKKE